MIDIQKVDLFVLHHPRYHIRPMFLDLLTLAGLIILSDLIYSIAHLSWIPALVLGNGPWMGPVQLARSSPGGVLMV
jgi:hypothetical protein